MKKTFKRVLAIFMIVLTLFSCCSIVLAAKSAPAVIDVVYDENGNRLGFKTIKVGDTEYYDIFGGNGTSVEDLSVGEFYKNVITAGIPQANLNFPYLPIPINVPASDFWGSVAANVFKAAGRGYGWNWDLGKTFEEYYGAGVASADNGVYLAKQLGDYSPFSKGEVNSDCVRGTGLQAYSSLNLVQEVMLDQIIEVCGEGNDAEAFKKVVLKFCTDDEEGFELFKNKDEQVVLANIITHLNVPAALQREFSSFGIVYYDFKLTPVIEENLQYISAADNYESIKDAFKDSAPGVSYVESNDGLTSMSYIQNPTSAPASVSASSSKSVTDSVSNSFSESDSHSYTESVSTNLEFTPIKDFFKFSVNVGFSASQSISTAYSESTSVSETISTSSSASVTLPPYTELGIQQTMSSVEQSVEYDCPVYVTYKVAVFGLNAEYIKDKDTGSWSITNYDQGCIFTNFGTDSKAGGISATDNLYNRWNERSKAFEISHGNVTYGMWEDQNDDNPPLKINYIDWSQLGNQLDSATSYLKNNIPMSSVGGTMTFKTESYNTEITQVYPMYDLKKVRFEGDGTYNLAIGGDLDLNMINVVGLNSFDQPYYGFRPTMGTWQLCDKDGNDLPAYEEGKGITVTATDSTQVIEANELGEYYLRFDIDEEYYTKAADRKTYITNDDLDMTAVLKLSVTDTGNNHTCRAGSWVTSFNPTCVSSGERCKYCLTCGKRMAVEVLPKAGHLPVEIIESATCTKEGSKKSTCAACRATTSYETIEKLDHTPGEWIIHKDATCSTDGYKTRSCIGCSTVFETEVIAATGHSAKWITAEEATCTKYGREEYTCTTCGTVLETRRIEKETHIPGKWEITKPSSCTQSGLMQQSCSHCGAIIGDPVVIDPHEHQPGSWVTVVEAACEKDGEKVQNCIVCKGAIASEVIPALGHTEGTWVTFIEADCEKKGEEHLECTRCGHVIDKKDVAAEGHSFSEWHCANNSTHSKTCLKCGIVETNNCDYTKTVTASGCINGGYTTYACDICEHTFISDYTDTLGHDWSDWSESADGCCHERECLADGCDAEERESHNWGEWVYNEDGQAFTNGTKTRTCDNCDASETAEAENSSSIGGFFRSIVVFFGNIVHKLIYAVSLNWLFPELTITK